METWILFLVKAFSSGTPILYGTLGEIVNEKSGHLNLGVQGMMAVGGCAGFLTGYYSNNLFLALFAAFLGGVLTSLIYAFLTVTLMANQNVTGLTLTIFGVGLANFIGKFALNRTPTGTLKLPDGIAGQLKDIRFPFLEKIPGVGPWLYTLFSFNIFVYLAVAIAVVLAVYINHTKTGRNLRAIGENPAAADAAGIHVTRMKYIHLLLGGGICGLGGAYASMIIGNGVWISDLIWDGSRWRSSSLRPGIPAKRCWAPSSSGRCGCCGFTSLRSSWFSPISFPGSAGQSKDWQAGCRVSRVPSTTCSPS